MQTEKVKLEEFLSKLEGKQCLSLYDFSQSKYINKRTPIEFRCLKHPELGIISKLPQHLLKKKTSFCSECLRLERQQNWIDKVSRIHDNKYDYSEVEYIACQSKVKVICPTHGGYMTTPQSHERGGCLKCSTERGRLDTNEFITRSKLIHGDVYDYSESVYTIGAAKIKIICPKHGMWEQRALSHLAGNGCGYCNIESKLLDLDEFIKRATIIHSNKYNYSKVKYTGMYNKVTIICPNHGYFLMIPNRHLYQKSGCPKCRESFGELTIRGFLEDLNIPYEQEYRIPETRYFMDFYLTTHNIYIEFHGKQHYEPVARFGGKRAFLEGQLRDAEKERIADAQGIPLIVIHYKHLVDNTVVSQLKKELSRIKPKQFVWKSNATGTW